MTLRGEPAWGGVAAPAPGAAVGRGPATGPVAPVRPAPDTGAVANVPTDELEAEVYAARDLHGEERGEVRRALAQARSQMAEATYRRALVLARDTALLSIEECLDGARAMEWEPAPRPEFSLATIEAAVAEQERTGTPSTLPQASGQNGQPSAKAQESQRSA